MERVVLYIWTKYTFQSHLHAIRLIVQIDGIYVTSIISLMIYAMHFGNLVMKLLVHAKKHCVKMTLYPAGMIMLKEAHTEARNFYILWGDLRKPKHGPICELMQKTTLHLKYLMKQCKQREDMAQADAIAKSMHTKDAVTVWKPHLNRTRKLFLMLLLLMVLTIILYL